MKRLTFAVILTLFFGGCSESEKQLSLQPVKISVDPSDYGRFDAIMNSPVSERLKQQVSLLQKQSHDLEWFSSNDINIQSHDTVQMIAFDAQNRILGFCNGAFLSDDTIATAAHCNSVLNLSAGDSCEGKVIFAYKSSSNSSIDYIECGQMNGETMVDQQNKADFADHSLYQIASSAQGKILRPSVAVASDMFMYKQDIWTVANQLKGNSVLGLFIDPPTTYANLKSKYSAFFGQINEIKTSYLGLHIISNRNSAKSGNSGGPVYKIAANSVSFPFQADMSGLLYLGPLIGNVYSNSIGTQVVIGNPTNSFPDFFNWSR